jgi:pimeloyl-ACP methyl ester carboxylesterase
MPIIDAYGMRGNVVFGREERKEGKDSLVFIPGAGGNWTSWYHQRNYFSRAFNVFIMELPGHGAAQGQGAREIKSYALWIKGALDELKLPSSFVIGHSMVMLERPDEFNKKVEAFFCSMGTGDA